MNEKFKFLKHLFYKEEKAESKEIIVFIKEILIQTFWKDHFKSRSFKIKIINHLSKMNIIYIDYERKI